MVVRMKDERRRVAEKEAAARCGSDSQVLEDVERLIAFGMRLNSLKSIKVRSCIPAESDRVQ